MIFLYTFLLLFLGIAKFLIDRRVKRLERKYSKTAKELNKLIYQPTPREGNSGKSDPCLAAKRQLQIGVLAQKRDYLEGKHDSWQLFAEKFGAVVTRLRNWKGKKLPYTFGVVDVALVLYAIDQLGVGDYVSVRSIVQTVTSMVTDS
jgi:hypothetical protein